MSRHVLFILSVSVLTFFTQLGAPKLWDRDEPRNARCACEMLQRGDWIVPTFNEELRTHKPILLYWLMMASYVVFGICEFSARFTSAGLAVGTVLLTYLTGRRLFEPQASFWAAIVLGSTLMFSVAARAATPDSTLIFCGTLALCLYVYSVPRRTWRSTATGGSFNLTSFAAAVGVYFAMGLGVLAKGPVGLVLPTAVIGMFLLMVRLPAEKSASYPGLRRRIANWLRPFAPRHFLQTCWSMRPLTAVLTCAAVALPWYYLVAVQTDGEWLRGFLFDHNVARAMAPREGHHGSVLYYPVAILVGFFPWSVLAIPTAIWVHSQLKSETASRIPVAFLLCWIGVYVGAFTLAQTKLPSYVTPTYPALALLCGGYLSRWREYTESDSTFWPQIATLCLALVGGIIAVALPLVSHVYLPGEEWLGIVGGIPLVGGLLAWLAIRRQLVTIAVPMLAVSAVVFVVTLFGFIAPRVSQYQQIDRLLAATQQIGPRHPIASFAAHEPSWVYYAGQAVPFFRKEEKQQAIDFVSSSDTAYLITTDKQYAQLQADLPASIGIVESVPDFMQDRRLLLIGPASSLPVAHRTARTQE